MSEIEEYTVGCICALADEAIALRSFFDETYDCPSTTSGKVYTTGSMGNHKVVIARLPTNSYGISEATSVVVHLAGDFPNVRFCFMVGIAGGAPDPTRPGHDIRLGDVVVSAPKNGTGGVIQYDAGKAFQDQPFRRTQHLNRPPDAVLEAVSILAENYSMDGHDLQGMVKKVVDKNRRLAKQGFGRPDEKSDLLYKSDYLHQVGIDGKCSASCGEDPNNLVPREPREARLDDPMVHLGIIASGSRVVKDAHFRDALAKETDALCFEMEAAGLMNKLPCLAIKGICDYADSHKNDDWQKYAAMMAAAYAKELLGILQPRIVAAERKLGDTLKGLEKRVVERIAAVGEVIEEVKLKQQANYDELKHDKILNWLASSDHSSLQNKLQSERLAGTGQWVLQLDEFQAWLGKGSQALCFTGPPGAGKTHLASLVIHHLQATDFHTPQPLVAYMYCNYREQEMHHMKHFMAVLLKQVVRAVRSVPKNLEKLFNRYERMNTQPSWEELWGTLEEIISTNERCFIVVDGLDEIREDEHRDSLLRVLERFRVRSGANILLTSRYIRHLVDVYEGHGYPQIDIRASREDMLRFLDDRIPQVSPVLKRNSSLHQEVRTAIILVANGLFLVAMLHVTSLKGKVNIKQIKEALHDMSAGGDALLKAYEKSMEMIQSQEAETRSLAMTTLSWIAFSPSTLTLGGLQHAIAAEIGTTELNNDNVTDPEIILSTCAGLITLQRTTNLHGPVVTVHLVHETTQAYLTKTKDRWFPGVDVRLAQICLTYLNYTAFDSGACTTWTSWNDRDALFPLYRSIAYGLGNYVGVRYPECRQLLERLYLSNHHVQSCLQAYFSGGKVPDGSPMAKSELPSFSAANALLLAIKHKIFDMIPFLISHGLEQRYAIQGVVSEPDDEADQEFSLVHYAVRSNFPECIQILVATPGVDCDALDAEGRTALSYACESGYLEKVQLLLGLDQGVEWSPGLEYYFHNRIDAGPPVSKADINHQDRFGRTALTYALAVEDDSGRMTTTLLGIDGIDCTSQDQIGRFPIHWAAESGVIENVRLLLMKPGVALQLHLHDGAGRSPLSYAIDRQHIGVARALISLHEAEVVTPELVDHAFSSISFLDNNRYDEFSSELLSKLLVENSPFVDAYGSTMVHIAARSGSYEKPLLRTLLSIPGITVNRVDANNRTALWHCFDEQDKEMCQMLLTHGNVDVNKCDIYGNAPIHLVTKWGDEDLLASLLSRPEICFSDEDFFGTPLHYATYGQHTENVRRLLEAYKARGCNINIRAKKKWPTNPNTLAAEKFRSWFAQDMPWSPEEGADGDEHDLAQELLVIAAANDNPACFTLLDSNLKTWPSLPRLWRRKCLLAAAESGGDATLNHILSILRKDEFTENSAPNVIHLSRQSWNSIDIFDLARRVTARELNSWDTEGQTAVHAAVDGKDMRSVRIFLALGSDFMAKNMAGQVAEDYIQTVIDDLDKMNHWVYSCQIRNSLSEKYGGVSEI